ncbi:MAG: S8 family serine peptidase [Candidatus Krumholzibacteriia bacterium]
MRQSFAIVPGVLVAVAGLLAVPARAAAPPQDEPVTPGGRVALPGIVIVKFEAKPGALASLHKTGFHDVDRVLGRHAVESIQPIAPGLRGPRKPGGTDLSRIFSVRYRSGALPARVAEELARLSSVEYAEPQWAYPIDAFPDDPLWDVQSHYLSRMQFPAAWDLVKGETGEVVVAIVDGGTDWDHVDLVGNVWSNPGEISGNGIDDDANGFVDDIRGWNFANNTNDPTGLQNTPQSARHGTHTAGIVCARTDNGQAVAGASWNAKVMPICAAWANQDAVIAFGYQGILYAAANGADVVNCSWGGAGTPSSFELEVVTFALEQGTAVVAAAGNNKPDRDGHYPSGYPHVLSVANVDNNDVKHIGSNFGLTVDVSAQGTFIRSTIPNNATGILTGTSMSAPHAAAVCALVKTRWPAYTADQVMERVRVTSDDIDRINLPWIGLLGFGRVNALQALTQNTPAIRVTGLEITDTDGDGVVEPGETLGLEVTVTNFLAAATDVQFTLTENSLFAEVTSGSATLASLDSMESVTLPPFTMNISIRTPPQETIRNALGISVASPSYSDTDRFEIVALPVFVTHDINNIRTSVTSVGRLGFAVTLGGNGSDGAGFTYKNGPNLLFEGAMMMGLSATQVSNAARASNPSGLDQHFVTLPDGVPRHLPPPIVSDQQSLALFDDSGAPLPIGVTVRQDVFQYADAPDDDYIILKYRLTNDSGAALAGLWVGWFHDWDIDGVNFATNRVGYDGSRGLGYAWDANGAVGGAHVGTLVLTAPGTTSYRGIYNDQNDPRNPGWGIYDGFAPPEKWEALSGGFAVTEAGPSDVSNVVATGPLTIGAGESIDVAVAYVAGDDLADLQANADAAQTKWHGIAAVTPVSVFDLTAVQEQTDVLVRWRTSGEESVGAFRVFRSRNDGALVPLAPDVGTRADRAYSYRDRAPEPGRYLYRVAEVSPGGTIVLHGGVGVEVVRAAPARTFLAQNAPNPFNPSTTLRYGLAAAGPVRLVIYDGRGRQVRTLVRAPHVPPGFYSAVWDGLDDAGRPAPSGVYHARLELAGRVLSRRLTLVK